MSTDETPDPVDRTGHADSGAGDSGSAEGVDPHRGPDFADGKDQGAFRTIGEVAQAFGIRQHVLRYWEDQFPMLKPLKRAGGRRYYRPEDIRLIGEINRLLNTEGFTIRGARQALTGKGAAPAANRAPRDPAPARPAAPSPQNSGLAESLRAVRDSLSQALARG